MPRSFSGAVLFPLLGVLGWMAATVEGVVGVGGVEGLRSNLRHPGSIAMNNYGFTTKARTTLSEQAQEEQDRLFPKLEEIPVIGDIVGMYENWQRDQALKKMMAAGHIDTSRFPEKGCVVKGNSALCSVPMDVDVEGFQYKADVKFSLRHSQYSEEVAEALIVDGYTRWKGGMPMGSPGRCFALMRKEGLPVEVIPIEPGPEDMRRLPMELALRFDNLKASENFFSASLRAECKAGGQAVHSVPVGKIRISH